jgi:hypothetical protein
MPESQIILQMIAIVLLVWVPIACGLVFLIWAVKKTIWHGMIKTKSNGKTNIKSNGIRLAVFIGAAVGGVLPVLGALRLGEGFHVWRIILTSLFGAFSGGLIALFVGSIASAFRKLK